MSVPFESFVIFAGGRDRLLSQHVLIRVRERDISVKWMARTIDSPVAVVDDYRKNSTNYFGTVVDRSQLLKVAVSKAVDRITVTAHFDTGATRRHQRGEL